MSLEDIWLLEELGGSSLSEAGTHVNHRSALGLATVWDCIQIISGDVAAAPLEFKRRQDDDSLRADWNHPGSWLLNGDANRNMTGYSLRETVTQHALTAGDGMSYIYRNGIDPVELIPAVRGRLRPVFSKSGELFYEDRVAGEVWSQWDILHIKGFGDDGISGFNWLQVAKNSVGLGLAQDRHGSRHFKNGARPSVALKHPSKLTQEKADELLETWTERHASDSKPALLHGGLDLVDFPIKNSDAQWVESRSFTRQEIAAWFSMPPHKVGDRSGLPYNSIIAENQSYVTQTLRRWLRRWETECERKLISERDRRQRVYSCHHNTDQLVDTDPQAKSDRAIAETGAMLRTVNEGRQLIGLPPADDGDVFRNPNTSSPNAQQDQPVPEQTEDMANAIRSGIGERLGHLRGVMQKQISRRTEPLTEAYIAEWQAKAKDYTRQVSAIAESAGFTVDTDIISATVADWAHAITNGTEAAPTVEALSKELIR